MLNITFDTDELRSIIREEVQAALKEGDRLQELPTILNRQEVMNLLRIKSTKMSELMAREDFPKLKGVGGVLIPSKQLLQWIDTHTYWVENNSRYFEMKA